MTLMRIILNLCACQQCSRTMFVTLANCTNIVRERVRHIAANRTSIFTNMFVTLPHIVGTFSRTCSSHCCKSYEHFHEHDRTGCRKSYEDLHEHVRTGCRKSYEHFHEHVRHTDANRTNIFTNMFVTLTQIERTFSRTCSSHCRKSYEHFHEHVRHTDANRTNIFTNMFVTLTQIVRTFSRTYSSHYGKSYEHFHEHVRTGCGRLNKTFYNTHLMYSNLPNFRIFRKVLNV